MSSTLGPWEPLSVDAVVAQFARLGVPWWIAGGWAIDLFVGHQTRNHGDMDVLVLRRDQRVIQTALAAWDVEAADPPGTLRPWRRGEWLAEPVKDIWCRRTPDAPWGLQLMLAETADGHWFFRREPAIGGPVTQLSCSTPTGIPFLAPEVQLLYKAKDVPLDKDEADFTAALPHLSVERRTWLADALRRYKRSHPWLARLEAHEY